MRDKTRGGIGTAADRLSGPVDDALAANVAAAKRAADRSRTGGVWSLRHLTICWIALSIVGVAFAAVAAIASGGRAAAGAALGALIVGLFFSFSAVIIAKAGQRSPKLVMLAALSSYVFKVVALGVVLTVMPRDGAFDTHWMAAAVGLGLFVWLGAHMRYVWTTKIYYVDPG
jgi:ATP synthase protein I